METDYKVFSVRQLASRAWLENNDILLITLILMCLCGLLGACAVGVVGFATNSLASYACAVPDGQWSLGVIAVSALVAGAVVVLVAALGACAAWKRRHSVLLVLAIVHWVLAITEAAVGVAVLACSYEQIAFTHQGKPFSGSQEFLDVELHRAFDAAFGQHRRRNHTPFEERARPALEELQRDFLCCGVHGPSDFADLATPVPDSCLAEGRVRARGCVFALRDWIGSNVIALGVVLLLAALASAAGSLSSAVLIRTRLRSASRLSRGADDLAREALQKLGVEQHLQVGH